MPDHYTNRKFAVCYWQSFVSHVRKSWDHNDSHIPAQKVQICNHKGNLIGVSAVDDYVYHPAELLNISLYDWVRLYYCKKNTTKSRKKQNRPGKVNDDVSECSDSIDNSICDSLDGFIMHDTVTQTEKCKEPSGDWSIPHITSDINSSPDLTDELTKVFVVLGSMVDAMDISDQSSSMLLDSHSTFNFCKDHPLSDTHHIVCQAEANEFISNFVGAVLPRHNHGDYEYYCCTMLTLFQPWHTGQELKHSKDASWSDAFMSLKFTPCQQDIMKNFNLQYKCLDAHDDFQAELKKGATEAPGWLHMDDNDGFINASDQAQVNDAHMDYDLADIDFSDPTSLGLGKRWVKHLHDTMGIHSMLDVIGWSHINHDNSCSNTELTYEDVNLDQNGSQWKSDITKMRQTLLDAKFSAGPSNHSCDTEDSMNNQGKFPQPEYKNGEVKITDCQSESNSNGRNVYQKQCSMVADCIIQEDSLNYEQERAFYKVTTHSTVPKGTPLKMYTGGMGGTGKTHVLQALIKYFHALNESHRLTVVALTGTAAALIGGSTYHYMFGIYDSRSGNISNKLLGEVKSHLQGVDYIFFDEVSMLSCADMYKISARLCEVQNVYFESYGGLSMIFAGDFAQLPPAYAGPGQALYSSYVGSKSDSMHD